MKALGKKILWHRARDYIKRHRPAIVGVTGSSGKTLTKEAIALAASKDFRVRKAPFSYNTPIGVALSILGVTARQAKNNWVRLLANSRVKELTEAEPDLLVLELSLSKPGLVDYFARQIPFKIGVITNVQSAHLNLFTSKEMIAHEQTSLITDLPPDGTAILNADDRLVLNMREKTKAKVITYGAAEQADFRLTRLKKNSRGYIAEIKTSGSIKELHLPHITAPYHVPHIIAALACASALGIGLDRAIENLQTISALPGRVNLLPGYRGALIIDDTFNALPESTLAAIELLAEQATSGRGRRVAILGDMLELGGKTITWHRLIGEKAGNTADILVTVGSNMRHAAAAALDVQGVDVHHFEKANDAGQWLRDFLHQGDIVLIKGSRDMHMEEVTKRLLADPDKDANRIIH